MTLTSMTGFARRAGSRGDARWVWEIRTLNGRGLDMRCRLPAGFEALEPEVRERVAGRVRRGSCQIGLTLARGGYSGELRVNEAALDQVVAALEIVQARTGSVPPGADGILGLRGVLELVEQVDGPGNEALGAAMMDDLDPLLEDLVEARGEEGRRLHGIIGSQVENIERLASAVRDCPARSLEAVRERLSAQVRRLLEEHGEFDEQRLYQEAVMLAARADVQEEIDRLFAHVAAARELLGAGGAVGRQLDFLTQEFNREANTLCAKANHASLSALGLELKTVVDQMREQVQNVE